MPGQGSTTSAAGDGGGVAADKLRVKPANFLTILTVVGGVRNVPVEDD